MKKLIPLAAAALFFVACEKEPNEPSAPENHEQTVYGEVMRNVVTDYDGNTYNAVVIGEQVWMQTNLRTTHYADGVEIPLGDDKSMTEGFCYYPNGDMNNVPDYGYLYNWKAAMRDESATDENPSNVQGICPTGWHVPSNAEWQQLIEYVSAHDEYCCDGCPDNIAKALATTTRWHTSSNGCAVGYASGNNNATGFSALPAGALSTYTSGPDVADDHFSYSILFGRYTAFWSTTENGSTDAYFYKISSFSSKLQKDFDYKFDGISVRCLRD